MKRLLIIPMFAISQMVYAQSMKSVEVEVLVNSAHLSDSEARDLAKVKAQQKGFESIPSLIYGEELVNNDELTTKIKALRASQLSVVTLKEQWERETNTLKVWAEVQIDVEQTLKFIELMRLSEMDRTKLSDLDNKFNELMHKDNSSSNDIALLSLQYFSLVRNTFIAGTLEDSIQASQKFEQDFYQFVMNMLVGGLASSYNYDLIKAERDSFSVGFEISKEKAHEFTQLKSGISEQLEEMKQGTDASKYFKGIGLCGKLSNENNYITGYYKLFDVELYKGFSSFERKFFTPLNSDLFDNFEQRFEVVPCVTVN